MKKTQHTIQVVAAELKTTKQVVYMVFVDGEDWWKTKNSKTKLFRTMDEAKLAAAKEFPTREML